jgi:hypothetical protein
MANCPLNVNPYIIKIYIPKVSLTYLIGDSQSLRLLLQSLNAGTFKIH